MHNMHKRFFFDDSQTLYRKGVMTMQEIPKQGTVLEHPAPYLLRLTGQWDPDTELKLEKVDNPLAQGTLGDIGLATSVAGPAQFPQTLLIQPFDRRGLAGIVPTSVRLFCWDSTTRSVRPVWNSGINLGHRYVWAKIRQPGVYVPIGLPRDRLLYEALWHMAHQRRYAGTDS